MADTQTLIRQHNSVNDVKFRVKISLLILKRGFKNLFSGTKRYRNNGRFIELPVTAISESALWNDDDNELNWMLTAGKVQNLRIAAKRLNGLEIPANAIFSFWKHIGNPNFGKGYVIGREIREGCIVPTTAGGLCQLSNALYDAVLNAGFEVLERHRHTKVVKGSLAEQDRDAAVKWNYIDLRFRAPVDVRIETGISADKLFVRIKAKTAKLTENRKIKNNSSDVLNDCYSCGNTSCFKYPGELTSEMKKGITAFILDEKWTEYDDYVKSVSTPFDIFIVPFSKHRSPKTEKFKWTFAQGTGVKTYSYAAMKKMVLSRFYLKAGKNQFASSLLLDKEVAKKVAKLIPVNATHLVISQNLLLFLWDEGVLGGRSYEVLMTRTPMETLHKTLDITLKTYPDSRTLKDFRASDVLVKSESEALNRALRIITPHTEIAALFNNKSLKLEWTKPKSNTHSSPRGTKVLFPGSAVARKGAYEMRRLAKDIDLQLVVSGASIEYDGFWDDVVIEKSGVDIFKDIGVVIYPAYVEHSPRILLRAIANNIPIITTTACGISPGQGITVVPVGDYEALKNTVQQHLQVFSASEIAAASI